LIALPEKLRLSRRIWTREGTTLFRASAYLRAGVASQNPALVTGCIPVSKPRSGPSHPSRPWPRIELAKAGRMAEVSDSLFPILVHPDRQNYEALKRLMRTTAAEVGA
jgi:hypothetical protein